jgi:hypothetical protein
MLRHRVIPPVVLESSILSQVSFIDSNQDKTDHGSKIARRLALSGLTGLKMCSVPPQYDLRSNEGLFEREEILITTETTVATIGVMNRDIHPA